MHKGQKGLTLIELLIVVAILGIIAAVVIPNLGAFMTTGRISAANTELENVKTASLAYYAENELWPETSGDLGLFITGELQATYGFHLDTGFVVSGDHGGNYSGVGWIDPPGGVGSPTGHGSWGRGS